MGFLCGVLPGRLSRLEADLLEVSENKSFSLAWLRQNSWEKQLKNRMFLFWCMFLEVLVRVFGPMAVQSIMVGTLVIETAHCLWQPGSKGAEEGVGS